MNTNFIQLFSENRKTLPNSFYEANIIQYKVRQRLEEIRKERREGGKERKKMIE